MIKSASATFRFYEELSDFLPPDRRKQSFSYAFAESATVKQAIEALGVPHTEVEVVLVNGESVGFGRLIRDGDRVSVYPVFESLDVTPVLRLRPEPLRETRFLVDSHLGRLAGYLRLLGFDTTYAGNRADRDLVRCSVKERRVLLTRDRELLMHRELTHGVYVRSERPREQLRYLIARLDLRGSSHPFTRCMVCNGLLETVDRERVSDQIPPKVASSQDKFQFCAGCGRAYWRGSHHARMTELVEWSLRP